MEEALDEDVEDTDEVVLLLSELEADVELTTVVVDTASDVTIVEVVVLDEVLDATAPVAGASGSGQLIP